ncbi:MAG: phosphate ABC transporter permease PstA [Tabrizicola sp.]|uniref:phosphate ABC transporter permease PstA n=1 Tax=Tabrizicola sp. TaxID=2005166 RepID=UPI0027362B36|nr:phosphate ABC transporter permease PstA [Tabrizicola sp.]MDP3262824.1 phosphate ABC transporter permease PstA [Tabrizicola sp.]MDP3649021.1 phosphate ABC transporter permease PstA [Paracoccaceae bacterium]MDZ4068705.1 phosphate ABC transporter permease PstA [Tabrizicola sp.]
MTDAAVPTARPHRASLLADDARMKRRKAAETRFRLYGLSAIAVSLATLAIMLWTIFSDGVSAFYQAKLTFPVTLSSDLLDPMGNGNRDEMVKVTTVGYNKLLTRAFEAELAAKGIDTGELSNKDVNALISKDAAGDLRAMVLANPAVLDTTITAKMLAAGRIDGYLKGRVTMQTAERDGQISPEQLQFADRLIDAGILSSQWNWDFFTNPDASDQRPEAAGLGVAILGSLYLMILVAVMCVPVGVAASIYLEEFAPKNRWTDLIEVNISNLAAVPSIVYGILGLAIFINFMGFPQSSTLVGALVISLMVLPTIIIATRASIRAVPPSIRDAALGVGASKMQMVVHHVLPLAAPGILTGTILGLATALGETAPLLLIGMVAFVDNYPSAPVEGFLDPATALPVQVYGWAQRADPAFIERSSGAIIVLLAFLVVMNVAAIILRRKFERRW